MDRAGTYLGLARKAGRLALGEDSSTSAIADGKAKLVLTAADASPGAVRRITAALQGHRAPLLSLAWSRT